MKRSVCKITITMCVIVVRNVTVTANVIDVVIGVAIVIDCHGHCVRDYSYDAPCSPYQHYYEHSYDDNYHYYDYGVGDCFYL